MRRAFDVAEPSLSARDALEELEQLLHQLSTGASPLRSAAVRYMQCRSALMEGQTRSAVPGFLIQCVSISKFYEFIHLYHPEPAARRAFISDSLRPCYAAIETRRGSNGFVDFAF
jgi:hypothetical protein